MSDGSFEFSGLATMIGSMPHSGAREACSVVLTHLSDIPAWPQLPQKSYLENMYAQYSEGLPGIVLGDDSLWVDTSKDLSSELEQLYAAYIEDDTDSRAMSPEYAAGFEAFLRLVEGRPVKAVKGQITGPFSFALTVTDENRRPLLYDEVMVEAVAKHLRLKASWQERSLRKVCPSTIMSVDEPYLSSAGSAYVSTSPEQVIELLNEVLGGLEGLKAIHCCGNTDWSVLLRTCVDILSIDALNHGESLSLYAEDVQAFLNRGGIIAWGVVANEEGPLDEQTPEGILVRLETLLAGLSNKGVSRSLLESRSLITPACGLASVSEEGSVRALEMTAQVSAQFRSGKVGRN